MQNDLFGATDRLELLPLPDAEIYYQAHAALGGEPDAILQELIAGIPWRAENITLWGKTVAQPRLSAWIGDDTSAYTYSGIHLDPLPWTPLLLDLKQRMEDLAGTRFNSVLLNYYRDNRDSIGFHSDDEAELGRQPVIASLSLGQQRTFILKHKTKALKPVRLQLASGSVLLMKGETQRYWKHGIDKQTQWCGPRVNLTFRYIHSKHGHATAA